METKAGTKPYSLGPSPAWKWRPNGWTARFQLTYLCRGWTPRVESSRTLASSKSGVLLEISANWTRSDSWQEGMQGKISPMYLQSYRFISVNQQMIIAPSVVHCSGILFIFVPDLLSSLGLLNLLLAAMQLERSYFGSCKNSQFVDISGTF